MEGLVIVLVIAAVGAFLYFKFKGETTKGGSSKGKDSGNKQEF